MEQKSKYVFYLDPDYENFVPRKTRLKYSTFTMRDKFPPLFLGCFGVFFAFFMVMGMYAALLDYWEYDVNGGEITATITSCELLQRLPRTNRLDLTYVYTVSNIDYTDSIWRESKGDCERFPAGTQVDIRYNADNPADSRVAQDAPLLALIIFYILGIPIFVICLAFSILIIKVEIYAGYQYHQLRRNGIVLQGRVIRYNYETLQGKSRIYQTFYFLKVTSEFETPDGRTLTRTFRGKAENSKNRAFLPTGTRVMILYANDRAVIML